VGLSSARQAHSTKREFSARDLLDKIMVDKIMDATTRSLVYIILKIRLSIFIIIIQCLWQKLRNSKIQTR
jgi:hypothetical protein